jgi:hypothetical protein
MTTDACSLPADRINASKAAKEDKASRADHDDGVICCIDSTVDSEQAE